MRRVFVAALLFSGALGGETAGSVVQVTNATFRETIDSSDYVLLEVCVWLFFSSPTPPHNLPAS